MQVITTGKSRRPISGNFVVDCIWIGKGGVGLVSSPSNMKDHRAKCTLLTPKKLAQAIYQELSQVSVPFDRNTVSYPVVQHPFLAVHYETRRNPSLTPQLREECNLLGSARNSEGAEAASP